MWAERVRQHRVYLVSLGSVAAVLVAGCTIPPRPGAPASPVAHVVPADARAAAYGSSIEDVLRNPMMEDKVRAMFGPDWSGGQLAPPGASAYFAKGEPPSVVRIGDVDYVTYAGCLPNACNTGRVLLLIVEGGSDMVARLDDGGFAHYYAYGNMTRDAAQLVADSGWRALGRNN